MFCNKYYCLYIFKYFFFFQSHLHPLAPNSILFREAMKSKKYLSTQTFKTESWELGRKVVYKKHTHYSKTDTYLASNLKHR